MNKPYLIGMTGGSGSGKTTILNELSLHYTKKELCIICLDDYYFPREVQKQDANGVINFDLPSSLDSNSFHKDLLSLLAGNPVKKEEYTFNNKLKQTNFKLFEPAKVILCEGLFIMYYEQIKALLNYTVYIHTRESIQLIRRIKRDRIERNYPLDDVLYRYEHHVLPSYDQFILPYRDTSDLVIDTLSDKNGKIEILKNKINYFLDH